MFEFIITVSDGKVLLAKWVKILSIPFTLKYGWKQRNMKIKTYLYLQTPGYQKVLTLQKLNFEEKKKTEFWFNPMHILGKIHEIWMSNKRVTKEL